MVRRRNKGSVNKCFGALLELSQTFIKKMNSRIYFAAFILDQCSIKLRARAIYANCSRRARYSVFFAYRLVVAPLPSSDALKPHEGIFITM